MILTVILTMLKPAKIRAIAIKLAANYFLKAARNVAPGE
jgi:hypothetical protein